MVHGWHPIVEHIDSSQIHLWLAFLDEITDPRLLGEYRLLLSGEELQQQQRFYRERDRHRYLVTRALVRTVLSKYAAVAPREWRFDVNAYGKPSISAEHAAASGLEFNVSHTSRVVLLGVTVGRSLGVDVQDMTDDRVCIDIADRFFAPQEVQALYALPRAQQMQRFFEYWTLKESYIKARGTGLSIPLDRFWFEPSTDAQIQLTVDAAQDDRADRWRFWQLHLDPGRLAVALCAEGCDGAMRLITRRIVPSFSEEPLACPVLSGWA
jgi:4'-phosphopantetheinyl transferase